MANIIIFFKQQQTKKLVIKVKVIGGSFVNDTIKVTGFFFISVLKSIV